MSPPMPHCPRCAVPSAPGCIFISLILLAGIVCFTRYGANSISRDKAHAVLYIKMVTHIIQFVYLLIRLLITTGDHYQSKELLGLPAAWRLGKGGVGSHTTQACTSSGGSYRCRDSLV